jgi:hypothetical protein
VCRQEVNISVNIDVEYGLQDNHYIWRLCGNLKVYSARRTWRIPKRAFIKEEVMVLGGLVMMMMMIIIIVIPYDRNTVHVDL